MTTKYGMFAERDFIGNGDVYGRRGGTSDREKGLNLKATVGKTGKVGAANMPRHAARSAALPPPPRRPGRRSVHRSRRSPPRRRSGGGGATRRTAPATAPQR
jgi:hypothetical protein